MKITIVVTCMNRTDHLRKTLPLMLDQIYDSNLLQYEVIIVNWSSKDGLKEYLNSLKDCKLYWVEIKNKVFFNLAGARNAGGIEAIKRSSNYIAFIDADVLLPKLFILNNYKRIIEEQSKYGTKFFLQTKKTEENDFQIWGSCIINAFEWNKFKYNDLIKTYGHEDNELYSLLVEKGYKHRPMDVSGVRTIEHSDEMRMENYKEGIEKIRDIKLQNKNFYRSRRRDLF